MTLPRFAGIEVNPRETDEAHFAALWSFAQIRLDDMQTAPLADILHHGLGLRPAGHRAAL